MYKYFLGACLSLALAACGGSGTSPAPAPAPLESDADAYVNYMKTAFTSLVGQDSNRNNDSNPATNVALDSGAASAESRNSNQGFSTTNVQISGVDEADSLKFDGNTLLWLNKRNTYRFNPWLENTTPNPTAVRSYSAAMLSGDEPSNEALHFEPEPDYNYQGILTHEDHAALVGSSQFWGGWYLNDARISSIACFSGCSFGTNDVIAYTWAHSQNDAPVAPLPEQIKIDGSLVESRVINGKLYIVSQFSPSISDLIAYPTASQIGTNQQTINALTLDDLIPTLSYANSDSPLFDPSDCVIADGATEYQRFPNVISITQIDLNTPSDWRSSCYVGNTNQAFVSLNNVYLTRPMYGANSVEIIKFELSEDGPEFRASGTVNGSLSYDSYYFGEIDGKLAYVNTVYDDRNWWRDDNARHQLSVFEENGTRLELVAQIPNEEQPAPIGKPGEQIYAVRFMGERAYVVTFDKVDPLYVIDLSTPTEPNILGELEIPGFSSYIHVINDDLILGIGKNAREENGTVWFQGLNIRLFDVSDPSTPIALESHDYGLRGSHSAALDDPHAFTFVHEPNTDTFRFTVPMSLHGSDTSIEPNFPANYFFPFSERGLYQFEINTGNNPTLAEVGRFIINDQAPYWPQRSVINGDHIYYSYGDVLDVFEWGGEDTLRSFPESP